MERFLPIYFYLRDCNVSHGIPYRDRGHLFAYIGRLHVRHLYVDGHPWLNGYLFLVSFLQ
jgi:hypothetical protein